MINATREVRKGLEARVRIYDAAFKMTRELSARIDVPASSVREVPAVSTRQASQAASALQAIPSKQHAPAGNLLPPGGAGFAALRLFDNEKLVSDNFYWLAPDGRFGFLGSLPKANLVVSAKRGLVDSQPGVRIRLKNDGKAPAFFIHLRIMRDGKEILPSFWSDNFLTILPGESRDITWKSLEKTPAKEPLRIEIGGWNVSPQAVAVR